MVGQQTGQLFVVLSQYQTPIVGFCLLSSNYCQTWLHHRSPTFSILGAEMARVCNHTDNSLVATQSADTGTNKTRIVQMMAKHIFWPVAGVSFMLQWHVANLVISLQLLTDLQSTPMA